jgi:hypothetical protein
VRARGAQRGATLLEIIIAATILVLVLGVPGVMLTTSGRAYNATTASGQLDKDARRTLDGIARRLDASAVGRIPQAAGGPGIPWSILEFQRVTGYAGGNPTWGGPERIVLVSEPGDPDDGMDNDGDQLIDEKRVNWVENLGLPGQRTHVLCNGVRDALEGEIPGNGADDNANGLIDEEGLTITIDGERVTIQLTLEHRDSLGTTVQHTTRRVVALRN